MSVDLTRRALLSVSDKTGLTELAKGLVAAGFSLYSTGGTSKHLESAGLSVTDISEYTGFPEMMDGRLKTLHPKVFGGILCRHDRPDDMNAISAHGIEAFEFVVVNLYPFEQTIAQGDATLEEAIEKIDIGGPSLVRAAAKNHEFVNILTSPDQYGAALEQLRTGDQTSRVFRRQLMATAFEHTARYDRAIADYFAASFTSSDDPSSESTTGSSFPERITLGLERHSELRYGENPHQAASLYRLQQSPNDCLIGARQLNGKELSYNNWLDLDSAWNIVKSLPDSATVVIKHNNPCGAASADEIVDSVRKAMEGDPTSAFGSIVAINRPVDQATAEYLSTPGLFVEAIIAPGFAAEALEILTSRPKWKKNVRLMKSELIADPSGTLHYRQIDGGLLVQQTDSAEDPIDQWDTVTESQLSDALRDELAFGWAACRHVKSNAITVSRDRALCGVGAGQMSRVDSVEIAIRKSGDRCRGAVLASDAFFPFPDSIEHAAAHGIVAIIQPGGSKRDDEVISACNQHGLPMVFTGRRHFKH